MAGGNPPTLDEQMSGWWEVETDLSNGRIQADALADANNAAGDDALARMRRAIGSDLRLRNFAGPKAKADVSVRGDRSTLEFTPAGLFALVSEGAGPHVIRRPSGAVTRLASGRYVTGPIRHPGMSPLGRPLKDTVEIVDDEFLDSYGREIDERVL